MITKLESIDKINPRELLFKASLNKKELELILNEGTLQNYCKSNMVKGDIHYSKDNNVIRERIGQIEKAPYYYNYLKNKGLTPTLLLHGVENSAPVLNGLIEQFSTRENWRFGNVTCSISDVQSTIGFHADIFEVMLVQLEGKRTWEFWKEENMNSDYLLSLKKGLLVEAKAKTKIEADYIFELEPGDILYIPPYWGHLGTTGDNESSLSMSFSWIIYTPYMLVSNIIKELPRSDQDRVESNVAFFKPYFPSEFKKEELDLFIFLLFHDTIKKKIGLSKVKECTRTCLINISKNKDL
jgi:ribosomal protein L16 Arg81 hydroxylase